MILSHKIQLKPDKEQEEYLIKACGQESSDYAILHNETILDEARTYNGCMTT